MKTNNSEKDIFLNVKFGDIGRMVFSVKESDRKILEEHQNDLKEYGGPHHSEIVYELSGYMKREWERRSVYETKLKTKLENKSEFII